MKDVGHAFLSYVREDAEHVDRLQQLLEASGIRVWRDTASLWPGEDWRAKIRRAITDDALVFIACFSRRSLRRRVSYQNEELTLAIEQLRLRRPEEAWLIPVRFDDCQIPDLDIGGGRTLASLHIADLSGGRFAEGAGRLAAGVQRILRQHRLAHLICGVEIAGARDRVLKRISRTEELVQLVEDEAAGRIAVSVVSYGDHFFQRGREYHSPVEFLSWADSSGAALSVLDGLRSHDIQSVMDRRASAVECMLWEVARRLPGQEGRPALVSVGFRDAYYYRAPRDDHTMILPCPLGHDWGSALQQLRRYPGFVLEAIRDDDIDQGVWNQLGAGFNARRLATRLGLVDSYE